MKLVPYQKTGTRMLRDMLEELFRAKGIPHQIVERAVLKHTGDNPREEDAYYHGHEWLIDAPADVVARLRAARRANPVQADTLEAEIDRLETLYRTALEGGNDGR